jgi:hypothetical protein
MEGFGAAGLSRRVAAVLRQPVLYSPETGNAGRAGRASLSAQADGSWSPVPSCDARRVSNSARQCLRLGGPTAVDAGQASEQDMQAPHAASGRTGLAVDALRSRRSALSGCSGRPRLAVLPK